MEYMLGELQCGPTGSVPISATAGGVGVPQAEEGVGGLRRPA